MGRRNSLSQPQRHGPGLSQRWKGLGGCSPVGPGWRGTLGSRGEEVGGTSVEFGETWTQKLIIAPQILS